MSLLPFNCSLKVGFFQFQSLKNKHSFLFRLLVFISIHLFFPNSNNPRLPGDNCYPFRTSNSVDIISSIRILRLYNFVSKQEEKKQKTKSTIFKVYKRRRDRVSTCMNKARENWKRREKKIEKKEREKRKREKKKSCVIFTMYTLLKC